MPITEDANGLIRPQVLILGTADWQSAIPTNQHHAARALSKTSDVTFVESLGLRQPNLSRMDLQRMWRRITRAKLDHDSPVRDAVGPVVSPLIIPWHVPLTRWLNSRTLRRSVTNWLRSGRAPRILWTYTPLTYGLEYDAAGVVYHCVDLLGAFPGVNASLVDAEERRLAACRVQAVASSGLVYDHLLAQGFNDVLLWPNVADTSVFSAGDLRGHRERLVVFAGNITAKKLDIDLLVLLAKELQGKGKLAIAGPIAAGGGPPPAQLRELLALGTEFLGVLSPHDVSRLFHRAKVGIIPYVSNAYTRGVSPLKTFEYLAAGLPVVSTDLPGVDAVDGHVWLESGARPFVSRVLEQLDADVAFVAETRRAMARRRSWDHRGEQMRNVLARLSERQSR